VAFVFARLPVADDGQLPADADPAAVAAARQALACPRVVELFEAVEAPLTPARALANLVGAPRRTGVRFPADPFRAAACAEP
jgi:arabinofuranosyltransferase